MPEGAPALNLATRPQLLFLAFGDRDNLRLAPLAAVVNGTIGAIGLTQRGWKLLDSIYFQPGTKYAVYHDNIEAGEVTVVRGMWSGGPTPLFPLAGCKTLKPLASAKITFKQEVSDPYIELVASTSRPAARAPYAGKLPTEAEVANVGRAFGHAVGRDAQMDTAALDSLDFHARLLVAGATADPTLLISFIDPSSGNVGAGAGRTMHLFALGERAGAGYAPSYRHAVTGNAREVEFQRMVDHLDVTGDGVDELVLEAWRYGAENESVVLSFANGQWREAMRVKQSWCLDPAKSRK